MARKAFYSFHYVPDNTRVAQIRSAGILEGNQTVSDNEWEQVKSGGDAAIKGWIDAQMAGKSATIVMIGSGTAGRKWINYEIEKSWSDGKGLLGIYIHGLKNLAGEQAAKGANPFARFNLSNGSRLSSVVPTYDPPYVQSKNVYAHITENLAAWVEDAIARR